jgi:integrase
VGWFVGQEVLMPSTLTATAVKALVAKGQPGRHAAGDNLYLAVTGAGAAKWTFRFMLAGRARELGLGVYDGDGRRGVTLAGAKAAAEEARRLLREGIDPVEHRKTQARLRTQEAEQGQTFREVADLLLASHEAGWRNAKHRQQWRNTLETYAFPEIGHLPVSQIGTEEVLRVLQRDGLWTSKPETASRLRGRIEAVLSYATALGWRTGTNPATWRGHLSTMLPKRSKIAAVEHHAALPWQEIGRFLIHLQKHRATAARALEFLILTATRTGEVLGAKWREIDLDAAIWTIPASRMKAGKEHRVPLSSAALAILRTMEPPGAKAPEGYVFPGQKPGAPLSQMSMAMLLRRMKRTDITVHGFRSTFRDWAEEATSTPHTVSEAALAHTINSKAEAAYRRGDLFRKRAVLMESWAAFCGSVEADAIPLHSRREPRQEQAARVKEA